MEKEMNLQEMYNEWRQAGEEAIEGTDMNFTWDCGEGSAREDFAYYWGIDELSFEEMLELESNY